MGDTPRDPMDHARTTRPRAGEGVKDTAKMPGFVLLAVGVVAFAICLASFALGQAGVGVPAVVTALLAVGAGLAWLGMERRRLRAIEPHRSTHRHGAAG
ncbi:protein UsfY [Mycobacterium sp.]|uniref:protein UsfY n=1 Tax=Mycobacterium sp. TaxID=1785 RepID=UPI003D6BB266